MAVAPMPLEELRTAGLADVDPDIADLLERELERQRGHIELIASENFTWPSMLEAVGSVATNKYAEGYPGRRYRSEERRVGNGCRSWCDGSADVCSSDLIELIASENFTWPSMLEAVGSVATNKYAEGYPGRRYYGGCAGVEGTRHVRSST